jgi:hypothetical protein
VSTGHSLGGGLAGRLRSQLHSNQLQAAIALCHMQHVKHIKYMHHQSCSTFGAEGYLIGVQASAHDGCALIVAVLGGAWAALQWPSADVQVRTGLH